MVRRKLRTSSVRKIFRRTAKRTTVIYKKRKSKKVSSAIEKEKLHGIRKKGAKSEKTVERLFGGHLSARETERVIKDWVRVKYGIKSINDVEIKYRKYVEMLLQRKEE